MDELLSLFNTNDDGEDNASAITDQTVTADDHSESNPNVQQHQQEQDKRQHDANIDFGSFFNNDSNFANDATSGTNHGASKARGAISQQKSATTTNPPSTKSFAMTTTNNNNNNTIHKKKHDTTSSNTNNTTSCDPLTGLRITDRRTSRADMVDAFSPFHYKSCSMLAAASRSDWTALLVDGGSGGGGAPSGKTNIATCGILTTDAGSRLSSKTGRAFAMLTLGDLPSSMTFRGGSTTAGGGGGVVHASITVFLFGDALRILHDKKSFMRTGWAVAVLGPNVMPPQTGGGNGGNGTSISFSINDPRQILPIGRAMDCDRCKGMTKKRMGGGGGGGYGHGGSMSNNNNRWEEVRCNTLIDLRICQAVSNGSGGYCPTHKKQGLSSANSNGHGKSAGGGNTNMTFVQKLRMGGATTKQGGGVGVRGRGVVGKTVGNGVTCNNVGRISGQSGGRAGSSLSFTEAMSQAGLLGLSSASNPSKNRGVMTMATPQGNVMTYNPMARSQSDLLGGVSGTTSSSQMLKRAPLHMKKTTNSSANANRGMASTTTTGNNHRQKVNPYKSTKVTESVAKQSSTIQSSGTRDLLGEALHKKRPLSDILSTKSRSASTSSTKKSSLVTPSSHNKRPCKVFHVEGYDGSVQVPKPNAILFQNGTAASASLATNTSMNDALSPKAAQDILEKQRNLAAELMKRKEDGANNGPVEGTTSSRKLQVNKESLLRSKQNIIDLKSNTIRKNSAHSTQPTQRDKISNSNNKKDDFASFFGGSINDSANDESFDRDAILNAKSRFATASNAEEYARARSVIQQLEVKEHESDKKKDRIEKKKESGSGKNEDSKSASGIVTTGWVCRTCKKKTSMKPLGCVRMRHDVRQKRELKGGALSLGTRKERMERHGKDSEEGGLTLGAGLEWSGWRGDLG